ncbi:MAG: YncE family protein [Bacteroidetes bacterium]|nr:YncE family protein [Bacteroidota bacterium]
MHSIRMITTITLALCLSWLGCDSNDPVTPNTFPFNPDTLDFDQIQTLDYGDYVQPLLAYRNVFDVGGAEPSDRLDDYAWSVLFTGSNSSSATIIPFNADESLLVRCAEGNCVVPAGPVPIPYPNVSALQEDEVAYLRRWIEDGAKNDTGQVPFADAEVLLYVCNQMANRVAIVDGERMQVIRYVDMMDLGEGMMTKPHHAATEPDGSAWYVNLITGDGGTPGGSILKLSTDLSLDPSDEAYVIAREMPPVGNATFQKPGMMVLDPTSNWLFSGRSFAADPTSTGIARVDRTTMEFEEIPTIGVNHPHAIGVSTNGKWVLSASLDLDNTIDVIDAATGDLVDQLVVTGSTLAFVQFGASPDGTTVVVTSQVGGKLLFFQLDPDTGELTEDGEVAVGDEPWHPVFSPDGSTIYVPNRISHDVSVVDVASRSVTDTIGNPDGGEAVFSEPHGSAITADGSMLFIANRNLNFGLWTPPYPTLDEDGEPLPNTEFGNVVVVDTETNEVMSVIQMGKWASGMSIYDPR